MSIRAICAPQAAPSLPSADPQPFRTRLWMARRAAGMSQAELAAASKHTPAAISHYETGHRKPSLDNLCRLVKALGCSADYLLGTRPIDALVES